MTPEDCRREAVGRAQAVQDDPDGRLRLREAFYRRYGHGPGFGFGASELAFERWESRRGVLRSPYDGGSLWWRAINDALIRTSEEAALLFEANLDAPGSEPAVSRWKTFLQTPTPVTWYRAHNASVAGAYLAHEDLARQESRAEQAFTNIVLYRVLYAQALVEEELPGCLPAVAKLLGRVADPRSPAVDVLVHVPDFYPGHYPLTREDIATVLHKGWGIEVDASRVLDEGLILPQATEIYQDAARLLGLPDLLALLQNGRPVYPRPA